MSKNVTLFDKKITPPVPKQDGDAKETVADQIQNLYELDGHIDQMVGDLDRYAKNKQPGVHVGGTHTAEALGEFLKHSHGPTWGGPGEIHGT